MMIIDKLVVFIAPKILGGREIPAVGGAGVVKLSDAMLVRNCTAVTAGPNPVLTGYVHRDTV
jgi:riboflavin biosynthesis pyrimidine reductase